MTEIGCNSKHLELHQDTVLKTTIKYCCQCKVVYAPLRCHEEHVGVGAIEVSNTSLSKPYCWG